MGGPTHGLTHYDGREFKQPDGGDKLPIMGFGEPIRSDSAGVLWVGKLRLLALSGGLFAKPLL